MFDACHFASPLHHAGSSSVIVAASDAVVGLDQSNGTQRWRMTLPAPPGERAFIVGTPLLLGSRLVVAFHTTPTSASPRDVNTTRISHRVVVLDVATGAPDTAFTPIVLDGSMLTADGSGTIRFDADNSLGRAELAHLPGVAGALGRVLVTFGNARDIQPWHGYAFELDLDAWSTGGRALSGFLVTTPETDCGVPGHSGSRERVCGGGLWAPSGPLVLPTGDVILAPGNGQLDLERHDYANTLMRVGPGLRFVDDCDRAACAGFDHDSPSRACMESCSNLFIPRTPVGQDYGRPVDGRCDGIPMFVCWERLDYVGGSTPALMTLRSGAKALAYPTKDGSVYLVDAQRLGTMYDRAQLVPVCGTAGDGCRGDWAGMIVTQPAVAIVGGREVAIVPTFMWDTSQRAGVFALEIDESTGSPKLATRWAWPDQSSTLAIARFRTHPGRPVIQQIGDDAIAWVVETRAGASQLVGFRVSDGALLVDQPMTGRGMRFTKPLLVDDTLWIPTCTSDVGPGRVESWRVTVTH